MTLKEVEALFAAVRKAGATDETIVYLTNKTLKYMRDVRSVEFQKRSGWPAAEWPVVISSK
jgi:hypothetical protein